MLIRFVDLVIILLGALVASGGANTVETGFASICAFTLSIAFICFPVLGMYRPSRSRPLWHCVLLPVLSWFAVLGSSVLLVAALRGIYPAEIASVARWALFSVLGLIACRLVGRAVSRSFSGVHNGSLTVAIVGTGDHCLQLVQNVGPRGNSVYQIASIFDTGCGVLGNWCGPPVFRDRVGFAAYIRRYKIDELWFALPLSQGATILEFAELFRNDLIDIRFLPDVSGLVPFGSEGIDRVGGPAVKLLGSPVSDQALVSKAIFDRMFAFAMLLALSPLLLVIACAVKLSSRGPVLFKQRRRGVMGEVFEIYKFRSMHVHTEFEGVVKQATRNDPRVTGVGAFLRRTSLDELPQLLNVARGEMSIVGPRPHAIEHDVLYQNIVDGYIHRYRIRPGITGWAQVNGFRGETDTVEKMQRRVQHDLYYVSNWSFAFDMRIILMTLVNGFGHHNAY